MTCQRDMIGHEAEWQQSIFPMTQAHGHNRDNEVTQGNVSTLQKWHMWSSESGTPSLEAGCIFLFVYSPLRSKNPSSIVLTLAGPQKSTHWGSPVVVQQSGKRQNILHQAIILGPDPGQPLLLWDLNTSNNYVLSEETAVTQQVVSVGKKLLGEVELVGGFQQGKTMRLWTPATSFKTGLPSWKDPEPEGS